MCMQPSILLLLSKPFKSEGTYAQSAQLEFCERSSSKVEQCLIKSAHSCTEWTCTTRFPDTKKRNKAFSIISNIWICLQLLVTYYNLTFQARGEGADLQLQFKRKCELKQLELHQQGDNVWDIWILFKHHLYFIYNYFILKYFCHYI